MASKGNYSAEDLNNPILAIMQFVRNHDLDFECMLPAVVLDYDRATNIVTIQGAVNRIDTDGNSIPRVAMKVPCFNPCGNGIGINFPIKQGDTGWVIASDRDTSLFLKTLKSENPNTGKIHAFDFGFFIPDKIKGFQVAEDDAEALVIQTLDGTTKISIKDGQISVLSANNINIQCSGKIVANAPEIEITAETLHNGNLTFNGNLTVSGTITSNTDVVTGSVSLKSHIHKLGDVPTTTPVQN